MGEVPEILPFIILTIQLVHVVNIVTIVILRACLAEVALLSSCYANFMLKFMLSWRPKHLWHLEKLG